MSLIRLKTELKEMGRIVNVNYVEQADAALFSLTENSPANVRDGEIYVLKDLPQDKKIQAEAHEFGHLYVEQQGLIKFEPSGMAPIVGVLSVILACAIRIGTK